MDKKMWVFAGLGIELGGLVIGGIFIGQAVDREMSWPGYGVAGFIILGFVGWMVHTIFLLMKFEREKNDD